MGSHDIDAQFRADPTASLPPALVILSNWSSRSVRPQGRETDRPLQCHDNGQRAAAVPLAVPNFCQNPAVLLGHLVLRPRCAGVARQRPDRLIAVLNTIRTRDQKFVAGLDIADFRVALEASRLTRQPVPAPDNTASSARLRGRGARRPWPPVPTGRASP